MLEVKSMVIAVTVMLGASGVANASLLKSGYTVGTNIGHVSKRVNVGSYGDLSWQATSRIIGASDLGTGSASNQAGDPLYNANSSYNGAVGMLMQTNNGNFVCSGTLLNDRRSIATAAHCVSNGAGTALPLSTTIFFQPENGMLDPATSIYASPEGVVEIEVSDYFVNPDYTGEVIDQNDIAILRLADEAPEWATSHDLYLGNDLTGQAFNVAGYGVRGNGDDGVTANSGRLRQGNNVYDFAFGDDAFGGFWTDRDPNGFNFFGTADIEFSYISDLDTGLAENDMSGNLGNFFGTTLFEELGLGLNEVGVAGGDSGGPNFINNLLSGINSYGLTFGAGFGDTDNELNNTFGELSGYVPTWLHADFIRQSMLQVSAPQTIGVFILSFSLLLLRKRKRLI